MSRLDHETTTPEAAAEFERLNTPAYWDERPDPSECVSEAFTEQLTLDQIAARIDVAMRRAS